MTMNQARSSFTHARLLKSGLTVSESKSYGDGDAAVTLVRYSDGSLWRYDNGSADQIHALYGWREANLGQEPAWFTMREVAVEFNRGCEDILGEPEECSSTDVDLRDILG